MGSIQMGSLGLGPAIFWTDSVLVVQGLQWILKGKKHGMRAHKDLWDRIREGSEAGGKQQFEVEKVKGHATQQEVREDEDVIEKRARNDEADTLAAQGAACHWADPVVRAMQKHEAARIKDAQRKMIGGAKPRDKELTGWGADGLEERLWEANERAGLGADKKGDMQGHGPHVSIDDEEGVWQWQGEQLPEGPVEDEFEDEWG